MLTYHCKDDYITASKKEFIKWKDVDNKGNKVIMTSDMCISYQVRREYDNDLEFFSSKGHKEKLED